MIRKKPLRSRVFNALLEGKKVDFPNGQMFEIFMTTACNRPEHFRTLTKSGFDKDFHTSVVSAVREGLDDRRLAEKLCYANYLFRDLREVILAKSAGKLRMYVTVGTPLDLHGIDLLFTLGRMYIGVDLTLAAFSKQSDRRRLIFTNLQLSDAYRKEFVAELKECLCDKEKQNRIPGGVHTKIMKAIEGLGGAAP